MLQKLVRQFQYLRGYQVSEALQYIILPNEQFTWQLLLVLY